MLGEVEVSSVVLQMRGAGSDDDSVLSSGDLDDSSPNCSLESPPALLAAFSLATSSLSPLLVFSTESSSANFLANSSLFRSSEKKESSSVSLSSGDVSTVVVEVVGTVPAHSSSSRSRSSQTTVQGSDCSVDLIDEGVVSFIDSSS